MSQTMLNLLLQLSLFSMAFAQETVTTMDGGNAWRYGTGGGIVGLIVLVLDIIAFFELFQSSRPPLNKLLWALLVFFFPVLGLIIYYLLSDRKAHSGSGGYQEIA